MATLSEHGLGQQSIMAMRARHGLRSAGGPYTEHAHVKYHYRELKNDQTGGQRGIDERKGSWEPCPTLS